MKAAASAARVLTEDLQFTELDDELDPTMADESPNPYILFTRAPLG